MLEKMDVNKVKKREERTIVHGFKSWRHIHAGKGSMTSRMPMRRMSTTLYTSLDFGM